ncbi:MAG: Panacea domain-containing protein [Rhizobiaceae bacterium]
MSGDKYVAMEHGPVPSAIRDLLKVDSGYPDEILDALFERVEIKSEGNKNHVFSKNVEHYSRLSGTDMEYLSEALKRYGKMSFTQLKNISHKDPAYEAAWAKSGAANEMDIELWFDGFDNPDLAKEQLRENARLSG